MSHTPWSVYECLLDALPVEGERQVSELILGLTWTLASVGEGMGLAMSPEVATRTLPWAGTLQGRPARDLAAWVRSWQPHEAAIGMAALNAVLNHDNPLPASAIPLYPTGPANLSVFEHFRQRISGKRVVVIGRYPGLDVLQRDTELTVIERQPAAGDHPDPAAEYLLPEADWVFLTASTLTNKTFPRLAELARGARLVLMGPTTPWSEQLADFGVDYLAGVQPLDPNVLRQTVAEGGGTRIFEAGVQYAVVELACDEAARLKSAIAAVFEQRAMLKAEMASWYAQGRSRFPGSEELLRIDAQLSALDRRFKTAWDSSQAAAGQQGQGYWAMQNHSPME